MRALYVPVTDRGTGSNYVNLHPWWRDPEVLAGVGMLLAEPFADADVSLVVGPPSSGHLLGPLVAMHLGVGFGTIRKDPKPFVDSDTWIVATTPPDYRDRHLAMGARKGIIAPTDRVLAIDDVVDTGSQLLAVQKIVAKVDATWVGASAAVDLLSDSSVRHQLGLKAIFIRRDLP
jgi:adenine phosphoribosyltransferase